MICRRFPLFSLPSSSPCLTSVIAKRFASFTIKRATKKQNDNLTSSSEKIKQKNQHIFDEFVKKQQQQASQTMPNLAESENEILEREQQKRLQFLRENEDIKDGNPTEQEITDAVNSATDEENSQEHHQSKGVIGPFATSPLAARAFKIIDTLIKDDRELGQTRKHNVRYDSSRSQAAAIELTDGAMFDLCGFTCIECSIDGGLLTLTYPVTLPNQPEVLSSWLPFLCRSVARVHAEAFRDDSFCKPIKMQQTTLPKFVSLLRSGENKTYGFEVENAPTVKMRIVASSESIQGKFLVVTVIAHLDEVNNEESSNYFMQNYHSNESDDKTESDSSALIHTSHLGRLYTRHTAESIFAQMAQQEKEMQERRLQNEGDQDDGEDEDDENDNEDAAASEEEITKNSERNLR